MKKEKSNVYNAALLLVLKDIAIDNLLLDVERIKMNMKNEYNVVATKDDIANCIKNAKKVIVINKM